MSIGGSSTPSSPFNFHPSSKITHPMEFNDSKPSFSTPLSKWWSEKTVAVVTGANKGIGFALVKKLTELGLTVILTSRDINKGKAAAMKLDVKFCQLDVTDTSSITAFASWLKERFGGLDILVNNAGVSFNEITTNSVEHAETVIRTNFYGPKLLIEALLPLFRRSTDVSRILNVSSQLGMLMRVRNTSLKEVLQDEERLSEEVIEGMTALFLDQVQKGVWEEEGWPKIWTDYSVSKLALNAYSRVLARRHQGKNLSVNCFCPGFTRTSMTRGQGVRTAEDAAEVGARLALLPTRELPTGKFFKWNTPTLYSKM